MAVNIKTFVRAGGLYPGGFNGVTLLFQTICDRFFDIAVPFSPISLALNAIPAIISFKAIGKKFTVITSLMCSDRHGSRHTDYPGYFAY